MSVMEIKWGLVPDMAGTAIMRGLARDDVVRELTYTGRQFTGVEAEAMGFATMLSEEPREKALVMAREIAGKNPDAIVAAKKIFNSSADLSDAELLMQESVLQDNIIRTRTRSKRCFRPWRSEQGSTKIELRRLSALG